MRAHILQQNFHSVNPRTYLLRIKQIRQILFSQCTLPYVCATHRIQNKHTLLAMNTYTKHYYVLHQTGSRKQPQPLQKSMFIVDQSVQSIGRTNRFSAEIFMFALSRLAFEIAFTIQNSGRRQSHLQCESVIVTVTISFLILLVCCCCCFFVRAYSSMLLVGASLDQIHFFKVFVILS